MIPVFNPNITIKDIFTVSRSLLKKNISGTSPEIEKFEKNIASKFDRKFGIAVSNGTVALEVAFKLLNFNKEDEVIIPSFTIVSCLSAVIRANLKPVFCDVDEKTWNMTLESVKASVTNKTKAILMVHTYGLTAEAEEIKKFCDENKILIIEDAAEAHGQSVNGKFCGSYGIISTFSFYANKHITTGEGGIILTDDEKIYNLAKRMINLDFSGPNRFQHENLYWNYRMSSMQASLGLSQMENLNKNIKQKKQQGRIYQSLLKKHNKYLTTPEESYLGTENHYWVFGVLLKKKGIRDNVIKNLDSQNIQTRPFFWPLHLQQSLPSKYKKNNYKLNVSEDLGANGLYLPLGRNITKRKQTLVVKSLIESVEKYI